MKFIDAERFEKILDEYCEELKGDCYTIANNIRERFIMQPGIDSVEIIRCKNCKNIYSKDFSIFCPHMVAPCKPDNFCSYGEKLDDCNETT